MVEATSSKFVVGFGEKFKLINYWALRKLARSRYTIIFAHMPKAAGISLNVVMRKQYPSDSVLEIDPHVHRKIRYGNLMNMPLRQTLQLKAVSGHELFEIHEWIPNPFIYITVLRDPVERVLSFYSYILSSPTHHMHNEMVSTNMSLDDFLSWQRSAGEVMNLQCKLLSSKYPYRESHMPTVFAKAKNNLETYFLVGLTEQLGEALDLFTKVFHWNNVTIERENVTPNRIHRKDVSPSVIQKIEQANEYDMELYEIGKRLFTEQLRDPEAAFAQHLKR